MGRDTVRISIDLMWRLKPRSVAYASRTIAAGEMILNFSPKPLTAEAGLE